MSSLPAENSQLAMTEVLCPSQLVPPRDSEFTAEPSVEWFLPPSVRALTTSAAVSTGGLTGFEQFNHLHSLERFPSKGPQHQASPSPIGSRSRGGSQSSQPILSASSYSGLGQSMSQSNPFEQTVSTSSAAPTLASAYSNVTTTSAPASTAGPSAFTPIAPDPVGLQRIQASRITQEQEAANQAYEQSQAQSRKRRATTTSMEAPAPPPLRDEDKLLLRLKDDQSLPWKDIAQRFQTETGKAYMIPALQMRYKRLKERLQVWTEADVEALRQAHEYWESRKFDIISAKMLEFGATEKFSPRACQRRWQDMNPGSDYVPQPFGISSSSAAFSQSASPQPPVQHQFPHHLHRAATYHSSPSFHQSPFQTGPQQSHSQPSMQHQQQQQQQQQQPHLPPPPPLLQGSGSYGTAPQSQGQQSASITPSPRRLPTYPPATQTQSQTGYWS